MENPVFSLWNSGREDRDSGKGKEDQDSPGGWRKAPAETDGETIVE
jgi:hypothetical protein